MGEEGAQARQGFGRIEDATAEKPVEIVDIVEKDS